MAGNTGKAPYSRNLGGGRIVDKVKKDAGKVWGVRDIPLRFDWVKDSKEKLARRRVKNDTVEKVGGDSGSGWIVWGMGELGDSFEKYFVERDEGTGNLSCSCQSHAHGDARGFCSHQFAVALWEYDRDPYPCFVRDRDMEVEAVKAAEAINSGAYDHEQEMREIIKEIGDGPVFEEALSAPPVPEVYRIDPWGVEGWVGWSTERMVDEKVLDQAVGQVEDGNVSLAVRLAEPELANKDEIMKEAGWYDYSKRPEILDLEQVEPGRYSLPDKFTKIRHNQLVGLKQIISQWHDRKKFILVDAATGSGKTVLGIMASMEITGFSSGGSIAQGLYICTDRALQDQFWGDFEFCLWSAILKGRRNYPTANFPSRFSEDRPDMTAWDREQIISAEDCEYSGKKHCSYCDPKNYCHDTDSGNRGAPCIGRCPYKQAVKKLVNSEVGCMNTSYLIRACSGASWGQFAKKKVLIVDEADVLESTIMGYVEISVNEFSLKRMGIGRPKKKTVPSSWIEWAEEALYKAGYIVTHRGKQLDDPQNKVLFLEDERLFGNEKLIKRDLNKWENLCNQLQLMIKSLKTGKDPWVYDCKSEVDTEAEQGPVVFKPVVIGSFCEELLWKHFDFVMLMSATLISPFQMAEDLGMPVGKVGAVNLPSSFDPARSPVYICPVADNSFKHQAESFPILIDAIVDAINSRPGVRVLIHAVSYTQSDKITQELKKRIRGRVILTHERGVQSKNKAKGEYMVRPGCVLISPSMARGENLSDDLLRFQIIIKMPFGNLGDKQVKQRLYGTSGGKNWYLINTIRETVQMEGRLMRHELDWGETLILDAKFTSVWGEGENFFPEYFKRRMIFVSPGNLSAMLRQGFGAQFTK